MRPMMFHRDRSYLSGPTVLIDRHEVARLLDVSRHTVIRLEETGALQPVRVGPRLMKHRLADVEAYIDAQTSPPPTAA